MFLSKLINRYFIVLVLCIGSLNSQLQSASSASAAAAPSPKQILTPEEKQIVNNELIKAVKTGKIELAKNAIARGADINAHDESGKTLLCWAIKTANATTVQKLLDAGANPKALNKNNETPLHYAIRFGYVDIIQKLLNAGADPKALNENNETPLHYAAEKGFTEIIRLLFDKESSSQVYLNAKNNNDETPLYCAVNNGHVLAVRALLALGADLTVVKTNGSTTILHCAMHPGYAEIVTLLLDAGAQAQIDKVNSSGGTSLHWAAAGGCVEPLLILLAHGANVHVRNRQGNTALSEAQNRHNVNPATKSRYRYIIEILHEAAGNPDFLSNPVRLQEELEKSRKCIIEDKEVENRNLIEEEYRKLLNTLKLLELQKKESNPNKANRMFDLLKTNEIIKRNLIEQEQKDAIMVLLQGKESAMRVLLENEGKTSLEALRKTQEEAMEALVKKKFNSKKVTCVLQ